MPFKDPEKNREWWRERRAEVRRIIDEAKSKPCTDCGKQFPLPGMQFDHVKGVKLYDLAKANSKATSIASVLAEIEKCDVVCAVCHAIREYERSVGTKWHCNR